MGAAFSLQYTILKKECILCVRRIFLTFRNFEDKFTKIPLFFLQERHTFTIFSTMHHFALSSCFPVTDVRKKILLIFPASYV
jgi:hypothetical protein